MGLSFGAKGRAALNWVAKGRAAFNSLFLEFGRFKTETSSLAPVSPVITSSAGLCRSGRDLFRIGELSVS